VFRRVARVDDGDSSAGVVRQWMTSLEGQDNAPSKKNQRKMFACLMVYISSCLAVKEVATPAAVDF
jgi:hypothetical protein